MAHVARMIAGRAKWLAGHQAAGLPYPAGRKTGALYWTPKTIAYHLRRWPSSLGWRVKAAQAGALPARYAVIDGADEALLWAAPNSEALALVMADVAKRVVSDRRARDRAWKKAAEADQERAPQSGAAAAATSDALVRAKY